MLGYRAVFGGYGVCLWGVLGLACVVDYQGSAFSEKLDNNIAHNWTILPIFSVFLFLGFTECRTLIKILFTFVH